MKRISFLFLICISATACSNQMVASISGLAKTYCLSNPTVNILVSNLSSDEFDASISLEKLGTDGNWIEFCSDAIKDPLKGTTVIPHYGPNKSQSFHFDVSKTANSAPLEIGTYRIVVSAFHFNEQLPRHVDHTLSPEFKIQECNGGGKPTE